MYMKPYSMLPYLCPLELSISNLLIYLFIHFQWFMSNFDTFRPSEEYMKLIKAYGRGNICNLFLETFLIMRSLHMHVDPEITIFKICPSELAIFVNFWHILTLNKAMKLIIAHVWGYICIILLKTFYLMSKTCM